MKTSKRNEARMRARAEKYKAGKPKVSKYEEKQRLPLVARVVSSDQKQGA